MSYSTRTPTPPDTRASMRRAVHEGPFQAAATAAYGFQIVSGNNMLRTTTELNAQLGPEQLDGVIVRVITKPSVPCNAKIGYMTTGQTMAQAVSADQFITDAFDLNTLVNDTPTYLVTRKIAGRDFNRIPEASGMFLTLDANPTSMVGCTLRMDLSNYEG